MTRHILTREESQKGGRTRCAQPSMKEARERGFQTTMDRHPFFARKHLKLKIKQQNEERNGQAAL